MRPFHLSLTGRIAAAFLLGILAGLVFGDLTAVLAPLADLFIKIWQVTILPSVVLSLIVGIGSLRRDSALRLAAKGGLVLLLFWAIALAVYFSLQLAFPLVPHASFFQAQDVVAPSEPSLVDQFVPVNLFQVLAEGTIPAIVVFCLVFGCALMLDDGKGPVLALLRTLLDALGRITRVLALTFPLGVFVITARTTGTMTFEGLLEVQVYLVTLAAATAILILVVLPLLVTCFTDFSYREILSASSRAVLLGFATMTEFITLPLIAEGIRQLFDGRPESAADAEPPAAPPDGTDVGSYAGILVPVIYTFPLLGGLAPLLFILFTAWLYAAPLDPVEQARLAVVGIPTLFGSSKLAVGSLLSLLHLPADAYNLYLSVGILRQTMVAALSSMSIFSFSAITIALITRRGRARPRRAAGTALVVAALTVLAIAGLHAGFGQLLAGTYHGDQIIAGIEMPRGTDGSCPGDLVATTVFADPRDVPAPAVQPATGGDDLRRIRDAGVLRVGYNRNCIPFAFFNKKNELVGHDVEMAYDLAGFVNVTRIEFVPVHPETIAASLESGYCDIVMSSVAVTPARFAAMRFSDPYVTVHMAFVVPDEHREAFSSLDRVQRMSGLSVAVLGGTAEEAAARRLLPRATIVPVNDTEEFFGGAADALFTAAEAGYPMTMLHPFYDVSVIEPADTCTVLYGYPVRSDAGDAFLSVVNYWLVMERDYGLLKKKYDYWILGVDVAPKAPRWSVVRDVLHMVP